MNLAIRMVMFLGLAVIVLLVEKNGGKLTDNRPISRMLQLILVTILVAGAALLGMLCYLLLPLPQEKSNPSVMWPFLLAVLTGLWSLFGGWLSSRSRWYTRELQQLIVCLPIVINLAFTTTLNLEKPWLSLYHVSSGLLFFVICGILLAGIQERLRIASIPSGLRGFPIQLVVLFLIFLSLSFFRGIFFDGIF